MKIITYHSTNAPAEIAWLAYVILPNGKMWMVCSQAATEEEAINKIEKLYEREVSRLPKYTKVEPKNTGTESKSSSASAISSGSSTEVANAKRGQNFSGTAWVIHEVTREKRRIPSSELEKFLNDGWIRGGPRSK